MCSSFAFVLFFGYISNSPLPIMSISTHFRRGTFSVNGEIAYRMSA